MGKQGEHVTQRLERRIQRGEAIEGGGVRRVLAEKSLSITMFLLFALFVFLQSWAGHRVYNEEQREHGDPPVTYPNYLTQGHFIEAVFENWESEFLQMSSFVVFTVFLRQRGSRE